MTKEELDPERIVLLRDFLSSDECMGLIRWSEGLTYETGTVGGVVADGIRNNERVLVDDTRLAEELFCRAAPWLPKLVEHRQLVRFNERWRFYRYRPGQTFQPHRDGSYLSLETYEQSEVTFLIYLNDDVTGGETRFFADIEHVARRELGSKKWTPSTYNLRSGGVRWNGYRDRSTQRSFGSKPCGLCASRS